MDILDYKLIAHRGLHNEHVPENSMLAFELAIKKGYAIETDVHITLDQKIVIFHDHNLERMTGINKEIEETTYDEIKDLTLKNTQQKIPTFEEFLKLVSGKVPILIEIKNNKICHGPEKELLQALKNYQGKCAIESFNPISIKYFKDNAPSIPRGLLTKKDFEDVKSTIKKFFLQNVKPPQILLDLSFIAYKIDDLTEELVHQYKSDNLWIIGWTIQNKEQYEKAKKMCDGIIFENIQPTQL